MCSDQTNVSTNISRKCIVFLVLINRANEGFIVCIFLHLLHLLLYWVHFNMATCDFLYCAAFIHFLGIFWAWQSCVCGSYLKYIHRNTEERGRNFGVTDTPYSRPYSEVKLRVFILQNNKCVSIPVAPAFFFLPKVSQQIVNMQCHGKSTYGEYIFMRISTNPYHLQRRKKILLNNQEKRREKQKRNSIPNVKTPTFSLNLNTISVRKSKASFPWDIIIHLYWHIFCCRFDCSTHVNW